MAESLKRAMPTTLERIDRRTLACRYVPWGIKATVVDPTPDGGLERYVEEFASSAFDRQLNASEKAGGVLQRIVLSDEHSSENGTKVGYTIGLRRESDGLYGEARLLPSRIDDVEALLEDGVSQLSVEFLPHRGGTKLLPDGTKLRVDAHLLRVALVPEGAYAGSEVLAMREAEDLVTQVAATYQQEADDLDAWMAEQTAKQAEWSARLTAT
jgi:HK97 family phage prohead protease